MRRASTTRPRNDVRRAETPNRFLGTYEMNRAGGGCRKKIRDPSASCANCSADDGQMPGAVRSLGALIRGKVYTWLSSYGEAFLAGDECIAGEYVPKPVVGGFGDADAGSNSDFLARKPSSPIQRAEAGEVRSQPLSRERVMPKAWARRPGPLVRRGDRAG